MSTLHRLRVLLTVIALGLLATGGCVLRRAIDEARFFELRTDISPATQQFHRPHYRLTVSLGAKQHSVAVYDPKEVGATDEVKRFFVAWDALFSRLPFKPDR